MHVADTKTAINDTTVGLAEEGRDYVHRVTGAWTEATDRWVGALQQFVPVLRPESYQVPSPKEFVNAYFDIAEQALGTQRQLTEQFLDRFGSLLTTDQEPVQEKAAKAANA
jgi:hypothetical protein